MENCAYCNWGLILLSGKVNVRFIVLLSRFGCTQGRVRGGKVKSSPLKCHLDPAAWVLPGKINAMENCVHCNWGLTILSGEVNLRLILLL